MGGGKRPQNTTIYENPVLENETKNNPLLELRRVERLRKLQALGRQFVLQL